MKNLSLLVALLSFVSACTCGGGNTCNPGASGCPCKANDACDTGLVCGAAKTCGPSTTAGVTVSDPAARGCEVLVTESAGTRIQSVGFASGVVGGFVVEAPRTAFSFVAPKDAALPNGGVQLVLSGPVTGLTITQSTCVDSKGQKLAGAAVTLN
jgi:hypothetical protein